MSRSVLSGLKTWDKGKSFYTWLIHNICEFFEWLQNLWYTVFIRISAQPWISTHLE